MSLKSHIVLPMICVAVFIAIPSKSVMANLTINEVLADPSGTPDGENIDANGDGTASGTADEFVELVNDSLASLDISGWSVDDAAGDATFRHVFAPGTVIGPGEAILVFGGGTPPFPNVHGGAQTVVASSGLLGLNNGGDSVFVRDELDTLIKSMSYTISEGNDGQSVTRSPDLTGSFTKHWDLNGIPATPGFQLDGVTPFGIPEPSSLVMAFMASAAMGLRRR